MTISIRIHRLREVQKIRGALERDGFPRLQMSLLVLLTGAVGFVASFALLHGAGLTTMWIRYLLSFGIGYLTFLALLWLWLRTRVEDYVEQVPDLVDEMASPLDSGSSAGGDLFSGGGGQFDGGGASGFFESPVRGATIADTGAASDSGVVGDALGAAAEAEEFAIPLVLVVLVGALLLSSAFMIYSAPILFAELLVDGALSAGLYQGLRRIQTRHWLETALRRTAWPFVLTAAIVSASGWGMGHYAPQAHSIGEVLMHIKHPT